VPNTKIRVVHILEATTGGTRKHLRDLVTGLDQSRFDVHAICSPLRDPHFADDVETMRAAGAEVHLVPMVRQVSPARDYLAYRRLRALLHGGSCDIAHAHSAKAGLLGRYAARAAGVPHVVYTPHGFPFAMRVRPLMRAFYPDIARMPSPYTRPSISWRSHRCGRPRHTCCWRPWPRGNRSWRPTSPGAAT